MHLIVTVHWANTDDLEAVAEAMSPLKAPGTVGHVLSYNDDRDARHMYDLFTSTADKTKTLPEDVTGNTVGASRTRNKGDLVEGPRNDARWAACNTPAPEGQNGITMEHAATIGDAVYDHTVLAVMRWLWQHGDEQAIRRIERRFGVEFYP